MITANIDDSFPFNNQQKKIDFNNERNKIYFSRRKELKNLMKSINSHIDNNSQSYFLTLYYMDTIFTNPNLEKVFFSHFSSWNNYTSNNDIQMTNYVLLSLACLVVASKFNENDPHVPTMTSYIRLLYEYSKKKYIFNLEILFMAEVVVMKLLKYKLNYYTIYHYLIFFFSHGIIFKKTIENSKNYKKYSERKILEKIYIKSREIIDGIIDSDKNYDLYYGKDNYIIVIEIFLWSIENIMNIKIKDDENIFKLVYKINVPEQKQKEIYEIIKKLSCNNKKKSNLENNSSKLIVLNSSTHYSKENTASISNQTFKTSRPLISEMNSKFIVEPKSSVNSATSYSNTKAYFNQPKILDNIDNDFQFFNGLIHNELEKFKSNCPYQFSHNSNHQNKIGKEYIEPKTTITSCLNNYAHLNNKMNKTSAFKLNQKEKNENNQNNPQIIKTINNLEITQLKMEKEPIDNEKKGNLYENSYLNKNFGKIILINDTTKMRKKSLSCSKNAYASHFYNYQIRPSANISNNIGNKLKLEKINNVKINNRLSPHHHNEGTNLLKINSQSPYKKNQKTSNRFVNNAPKNPNIINNNIVTKYINEDEILNQNPNLNIFNVTKLNPTLQFEPQDNKRGSTNKFFNDRGIKDDINKTYNKANTIIINNNIHINTYIDKNNLNENNLFEASLNKNGPNLFLFGRQNTKKTNDVLYEHNSTNKYKNIKNRQKNLIEIKSGSNQINKSSIIYSHKSDNVNKINNLKEYKYK